MIFVCVPKTLEKPFLPPKKGKVRSYSCNGFEYYLILLKVRVSKEVRIYSNSGKSKTGGKVGDKKKTVKKEKKTPKSASKKKSSSDAEVSDSDEESDNESKEESESSSEEEEEEEEVRYKMLLGLTFVLT